MSRRISFPISSIINDYKRQELIEKNYGLSKSGDTTHKLHSVEYNSITRVAKISIESTTQYRTIDRYITRQYTKYPIYSEWKYKTKTIVKTIKLTNEELESLYKHEDNLISTFAEEIILRINEQEMMPSWLKKLQLYRKYSVDELKLDEQIGNIKKQVRRDIDDCNEVIRKAQSDLQATLTNIDECNKQIAAYEVKVFKIHSRKKSILLSIITFSIYAYWNSDKRAKKLLEKQRKLVDYSKQLDETRHKRESEICASKDQILLLERNAGAKVKEIQDRLITLQRDYENDIAKIQPLPTIHYESNGFFPLKHLSSIAYQKILGCYIIHNVENGKYYVGQSKDILKRLKQHFRGTQPNNIIFAEDYYSSHMEHKEDMFEVRIVPLQTKDELDPTEKELIEYYDAYQHGYNGTSGNG